MLSKAITSIGNLDRYDCVCVCVCVCVCARASTNVKPDIRVADWYQAVNL